MNPLDFLTDLFNPDLAFLPKALAIAVMSSIVCGVVGTHVVLRGMAFIGDAVCHAVFPGLAVAFVVGGNLVVGGVVAGVVTAILVTIFSQSRRLNESSVIGVLFVAAFALGVVIISRAPGYAGSLQQFLFGSITGIPTSDLWVAGIAGIVVLGILFALHKELVTVSLDRESARAMGLRVFWLDLVLYILVTLAVVISVQTIGNILVLALLVTPAATARLLTDRLGVMMFISPAIGALGAVVGLYLSWSVDLPTGGTIVLVLTILFLAAWLFSPKQGLVVRAIRRAAENRAITGREAAVKHETASAGDAALIPGIIPVGVGASLDATAAPAEPAVVQVTRPARHALDPQKEPMPTNNFDQEILDPEADLSHDTTTFIPLDELPPIPPVPTEPDFDPGPPRRQRGWLLPVVTSVLVALAAGALIAFLLVGRGHPATKNKDAHHGQIPAAQQVPAAAKGEGNESQAQPKAGIGALPDAEWVSRTSRQAGIPERALYAYAGAALTQAKSQPQCKLGWNTLAAIGKVESDHGSLNGASINAMAVVTPSIVGPALNGDNNTAKIKDSDAGKYDGDTTWDHAVGPMQFIPSTWEKVAQDGNGDGTADVNQFDDAVLSAAVYLCDSGKDLSVAQNWIEALSAYNRSTSYNNDVAEAAARYAQLQ